MHIANIDFENFYKDAFSNTSELKIFFNQIEGLPSENNKALTILHQAARMIWLADRIEEVAKDRPALQILFYLIAAEAVAKIVRGFEEEGGSRKHVQIFFEEICNNSHKAILSKAFDDLKKKYTVREAIDFLYNIRCDVVHEGKYFNLTLPDEFDDYPEITGRDKITLTAYISIKDLRKIVLEGSVLAAKQYI
ncbi:MAG: hypothetical protein ABIK98_11545 [Pseudomonadota bacterium]